MRSNGFVTLSGFITDDELNYSAGNIVVSGTAMSSSGQYSAFVTGSAAGNIYIGNTFFTGTSSNINAWKKPTGSFHANYTGVTCTSNGSTFYTCADSNNIFKGTSSDGWSSSTWSVLTSAGSRKWTSITTSADGIKVAACVNPGNIYISSDSGVNWTDLSNTGIPDVNWTVVKMSADGNTIAACANPGNIYMTENFGLSWNDVSDPSNAIAYNSTYFQRPSTWSSLALTSNGKIFYATNGNILSAVDSSPLVIGTAFDPYPPVNTNAYNWSGVSTNALGNVVAACVTGGNIYVSQDSGTTWVDCSNIPPGTGTAGTPVTRNWSDVSVSLDGKTIWGCINDTAGGFVYRSLNSGQTWVTYNIATHKYTSIKTIDGDIAVTAEYILSGDNRGIFLFKSTNNSSSCIHDTDINFNSATLTPVNKITGKIKVATCTASSTGTIYVSTEFVPFSSVPTWTASLVTANKSWSSISMSFDGTKIAACQNPGNIYLSVNSGITWMDISNAGTRNWSHITMCSLGRKVAATDYGGYIYTSYDSGATFDIERNTDPGNWSSTAISPYGRSAYACSNSGIYRQVMSERRDYMNILPGGFGYNSKFSCNNIAMSKDGQKCYAPNLFSRYVYKSVDGGITWNAVLLNGITYPFFRCDISCSPDGDTVVLAVMNNNELNGNIFVSTDGLVSFTPLDI